MPLPWDASVRRLALGAAILGSVAGISLKDLDEHGCLEFRGYHSSDWEQRWLQDVDTLQKGACEAMKQDADLGRGWVQQAALAHELRFLPSNSTIWSYMEYSNTCHRSLPLFVPVEPLVGLLRHPFGHPHCYTPEFMEYNIENRSHLLAMPMSAPLSAKIFPGKKYLLDLGCGGSYGSSLAWFVDKYHMRGLDFDEVWGWEAAQVDATAFWASVPPDVMPKLHFYNAYVSDDFKSPANPVNIISSIVQPGDMVVVKLDIDTEWLEQAIMGALMERHLLSVLAELYFEQHFSGTDEMNPYFGYDLKTTLKDTMHNFVSLRRRGIRIHYWP
eukprot:jgi/Astpho2/7234/Aster-x1426